MRLNNRTSFVAEEICRLPRPGKNGENDIPIRIRALPVGFNEKLSREIPPPRVTEICPRQGIARDEHGKVIKTAEGAPVWDYDRTVPEYQQALLKHQSVVLVAQIYESVKDANPDLIFDTHREECKSAREFYEKITQELDVAGFGAGDVILLAQAVNEISNLSDDKIERAKAGFLLDTRLNNVA